MGTADLHKKKKKSSSRMRVLRSPVTIQTNGCKSSLKKRIKSACPLRHLSEEEMRKRWPIQSQNLISVIYITIKSWISLVASTTLNVNPIFCARSSTDSKSKKKKEKEQSIKPRSTIRRQLWHPITCFKILLFHRLLEVNGFAYQEWWISEK